MLKDKISKGAGQGLVTSNTLKNTYIPFKQNVKRQNFQMAGPGFVSFNTPKKISASNKPPSDMVKLLF